MGLKSYTNQLLQVRDALGYKVCANGGDEEGRRLQGVLFLEAGVRPPWSGEQ